MYSLESSIVFLVLEWTVLDIMTAVVRLGRSCDDVEVNFRKCTM